MPSHHHNNINSNNNNKLSNSFDQKPLNLPVNELFKRYELKRQAADSTAINDSIHASMGSLQSNQIQNKINNNEFLNTPRLNKKI